jgi:hypothetical protein
LQSVCKPRAASRFALRSAGEDLDHRNYRASVPARFEVVHLTFQNRIRQLVAIVGTARKVLRQELACFLNRMHDCVGKILRLEMGPHRKN